MCSHMVSHEYRRKHIWLQCGPNRGWREFRAERRWVGAAVGKDLWEGRALERVREIWVGTVRKYRRGLE